MEKADLGIQGEYRVDGTICKSDLYYEVYDPGSTYLEVLRDGSVKYFDREGFLEFARVSKDPYVVGLLAIYELGFIDGMKN